MLAIAEMSPAARKRAQKAYPGIQVTADDSEVISSPDDRRHRRRHSGLDALRTGEGCAGEWQARLRREAVHQQCRAGERN